MPAFQATYSDFKLIRTRKVVQIVLEVPVEQCNQVLEILGGMPNPASERWVGVAVLKSPQAEKESEQKTPTSNPATPRPVDDKPPAGAKRDWRSIPIQQRAGILVNEAAFATYLRERHSDEWHETGEADACLKLICGGIESKRDLAVNTRAGQMFDHLTSDYRAWQIAPGVGA